MIWEVMESLRGKAWWEVFRSLEEREHWVSWVESQLTLKSLPSQQHEL